MIGDLRTRLGLYVPQTRSDDMGGVTTVWALHSTVWADLKPSTSSHSAENGRAAVLQTYKVVIRHMDNFPERARLLWDERTLSVLTASDPDMRKERLHLICEEEQQ